MKKLWRKCREIVVRELRSNATPFRASLSLGVGILIGFSPFYGLHIITLIPLTFLFRLNRPLALLAVSSTSLPVVPFWVAAGIFIGKLTIPITWCEMLVDRLSGVFTANGWVVSVVAFVRRLFPAILFDNLPLQGHALAAGFVQWALGSCVLAVIAGLLTVVVAYPIFHRISRVRRLPS